jgi:hypothetical protein
MLDNGELGVLRFKSMADATVLVPKKAYHCQTTHAVVRRSLAAKAGTPAALRNLLTDFYRGDVVDGLWSGFDHLDCLCTGSQKATLNEYFIHADSILQAQESLDRRHRFPVGTVVVNMNYAVRRIAQWAPLDYRT